ncbi:MAG: CDP-alcohol phosphatidyltransferase family protein [Anaerolineae bacterium]|nr:CDP-alcohol phosphatidyltransferase family protein [Anaerolineae bacterium]
MISNYVNQRASLTDLRRRWWITVLSFILALWSGYYLLQTNWHSSYATRWLIVAAVALTFELWLVRRNLQHNHPQGEPTLLPTLGAGNVLTLARGLAIGLLAGFIFAPWPPGALAWLPALLYTLAAIADGLDGYLARRAHHVTKLGEILDMEFDAVGILVSTMLAVHYHQLPWWYIILGLARYLFVLGSWWRQWRGKPVFPLPFSITRRLLAGFQMGFTTVMFWPIVYPPGTTLAGIVFAVPFLTGFTRDWLIASGRIDPLSPQYLALRRNLVIILTYRLPLLLRLLAVVTTANILWLLWETIVGPASLFVWINVPFSGPIAWSIVGLALVAVIMLAAGVAGRLAAFGLVIVASANILSTGLQINNGLMLVSTISVMLLGTGAFSLWQPEDCFLSRRAGES